MSAVLSPASFALAALARDPNIAPNLRAAFRAAAKSESIRVEYGDRNIETGEYEPDVYSFNRRAAAGELRFLRRCGAYIERRGSGYYVECR